MHKVFKSVFDRFGMARAQKSADLVELIRKFRTKSIESKQNFWKAVAKNLEKPNRRQRQVNLSRVSRVTKKGETIVIPGKVLASGNLEHPVTIYALNSSLAAKEKVEKIKGNLQDMSDLLKLKDAKGVRIIG